MKTILALLIALTFTVSVNARTILVPSQMPTIQSGIDIASDGDTVLVASGRYTGDGNRDIDFGGKAILLKSEAGPEYTIIDANAREEQQSHRGFYFHKNEDTTTILDGFTITKGAIAPGDDSTSRGGGIICIQSSPTIKNCIVNGNAALSGGGIICIRSSAHFENCTVDDNIGLYGIDMLTTESTCVIRNCAIGVFLSIDQNITISCSVFSYISIDTLLAQGIDTSNVFIGSARFCGQTFYVQQSSPCLPENNSCAELIGALGEGCKNCDYTYLQIGRFDNIIDPNTIETLTIPISKLRNANRLEIEPKGPRIRNDSILIDIDSTGRYEYIVTAKSNCDSTRRRIQFTVRQPTTIHVPSEQTDIGKAIYRSLDGDTILLAPGIYYEQEIRTRGRRLLITSEKGPDSTIINCIRSNNHIDSTTRSNSRAFIFKPGDSGIVLSGITIRNGYADNGGAIYADGASMLIYNCIFEKNEAIAGGAIYSRNSSIVIDHCLFSSNFTIESGGNLMFIYSSTAVIKKSNFVYNSSAGQSSDIFSYNSSVHIAQTNIVFGEGADAIYLAGSPYQEISITLECSNIFGNSYGDWPYLLSDQKEINGNFSEDPQFCNPESNDFSITNNSPCAPANNECGVVIGYLGIGCYPTTVETVQDESGIPTEFALIQNFPNPFNPTTTISFDLPTRTNTKLIIYNLMGRVVTTLIDQPMSAGRYQIRWDGKNSSGQYLSSGVYFYKIITDENSSSRKMVMLK